MKKPKLEFKTGKIISPKGQKPVLWSSDRGYYFKGELLHLYKNKAISILRDRVIKEGLKLQPLSAFPYSLGKDILRDEAYIIEQNYKTQVSRTLRIEAKKQAYYKELKKQSIQNKIKKLEEELNTLKNAS